MSFVSKPDVTLNIVAGASDVENAPQKVLMIGQGSSGTVAANSWTQNIGNSNNEDALFGRKTMIASMVRAFKSINTLSQVDVINVSDPASSNQATATITFTGTATASGNFEIAIQSEKLHKFSVPVSVGYTNELIAASLDSKINADDSILFSSSVTTDTVTITAVAAGTEFNDTPIRVINNIAGITAVTTAVAGGTGQPTIPSLDDTVGDTRYQTIVYPASYDNDTIKDFIDDRLNATNIVLDGVAILTVTGDSSAVQSSASNFNSQSVVVFGNKLQAKDDLKGGSIVEMNTTLSSYFAAVRSLRLTDGANIAKYLVGNGIVNTTGGTYMAAAPYHNTPIAELPVIVNNYGWSRSEQTALNAAGVSFMGNNTSLNSIIVGDVVTTYLTNASGLSDVTFKYLNYVDTSSNVREYFFNNNKKEYAQASLTNGDLVANVGKMANKQSIYNYQFSLYETLAGDGYALVQAGKQAFKYFKQNLSVDVTTSTGLANISMIVPITTQLRGINGTIQIGFNIE